MTTYVGPDLSGFTDTVDPSAHARAAFPFPGTAASDVRPASTTATSDDALASLAELPMHVSPDVKVDYLPVLDVARGVAAGYQAQAHQYGPRELDIDAPGTLDNDSDGFLTASAVSIALNALPTLPRNTFVALPISARVGAAPRVREALARHGSLAGVILDITAFDSRTPIGELESALADYRAAGAMISVGGHGASQPELTSLVRLKPSIVRLGRDWVRGIDASEAKRSAIEVIGRLAGQLDAWILAEGVSSAAELRALAGLGVPLAQGPFIGSAHTFWPSIELTARTALPKVTQTSDGVLRALIQQAYTAHDAKAAAAVLPETSGFDIVVVLDEHQRPQSLLEQDGASSWAASDVLSVNIDTPVADAVSRAMTRPRLTRFSPLACTDDAGRFLGILRIERLMEHLAAD